MEDPVYKICGAKISLKSADHPRKVTVVHSVPEDYLYKAEQRTDRNSCDATIIIGNKELYGHKAILSARSKFFHALFNSSMTESTTGIVNLSSKFCEFNFATLENLLNYVYTGLLTITVNNVQEMMMGAAYLQIESIIDECARFMRKRITFENALPLFIFFKSIGYDKLDDYVLRFIDKNFVSISGTAEFLEIDIELLVALLDRDSLYVDNEEQVFEAVARWIEGDPVRKIHAIRLLKCVCCARLSVEFIISTVENSDWIMNSPDCNALVNEAKECITKRKPLNNVKSFKTAHRHCENAHSLIMLLGTCANSKSPQEDDLVMYDPIADSWTKCKNLMKTRGTSIAVLNKKFYIFGSFRETPHEEISEYYDIILDEWFPMPNYSLKRYAKSTCVIDGEIYVVGGCDGSNVYTSMEAYDPSTQGWYARAPMTKARRNLGTCAINGKLYVIGGCDERWNFFLDGECYDPEMDSWTPIAPMKYARWGFDVAALDGKIYVVGGANDEEGIINNVERYDPATNTWSILNGMKMGRVWHNLAVACGKLFAIGGYNTTNAFWRGEYHNGSVEMYHPEGDYWENRALMGPIKDYFVVPIPIPATFPSPVANLEGIFDPIHCSGFASFLLKDELLQAITDIGLKHPSEVQHEYIPRAMRGMSFVCQAKSGTGKTTAFLLAILHQ